MDSTTFVRRRAVHDGVETLAVDRLTERLRIRDVGDAERDVGREVGAVAGRDVVHNDHQIPARLKRVDDRATDEAGAAGHEYAHLECSFFPQLWRTSAVDKGRERGKAVDGRGRVLGILS